MDNSIFNYYQMDSLSFCAHNYQMSIKPSLKLGLYDFRSFRLLSRALICE